VPFLPFRPPDLPDQRRPGRSVRALADYLAHPAKAEMVEHLDGADIVGGGGFAEQVEAEMVEHPGEALLRAGAAAALALAVGVDRAAELAGRPLRPEAQIAVAADPAGLVEIEKQQAAALVALRLVVGDKGAHRFYRQRAGQGVDRRVDARVCEKFVEPLGIPGRREAGRVAAGAARGGGDGGADRGGLGRACRVAGDRDAMLCRHGGRLAAFVACRQGFSRGRSAPARLRPGHSPAPHRPRRGTTDRGCGPGSESRRGGRRSGARR